MKIILIMKNPQAFSLTILLTLMTLLAIPAPTMAQDNGAALGLNVSPAQSKPQGPTDPVEMEAFLDELLGKEMETQHIAGAAVSVVKDGKLFFAKGYGYADLENGIPIDPEQTVFRIGSITKLFTWTAVMQLVEQGKLDLEADINTYLDFRIPNTYPQPITLKHLLSHTAGFEDLRYELAVSKPGDQAAVREWLVSHMPRRVRPPGDVAAYSNYGASLAGYIVAQVSGQPYDQYIQENILDPLGMLHSTVQWPLPPNLSDRATVGYMYEDGTIQVFPELKGPLAMVPDGGMQASATDIARFMIAHLQNGRYRDAPIAERRILNESTAQQMHTTLYRHDARILGTTYGFFDFSDNGQRTLGHSGEAEPMNSLLLLLPDQNLGVFVTYNSLGGEDLVNQHLGFQRAFFDHYFPAPVVDPIQPPADFAERAGRFEGSYRKTQSAYTTLEKVMGVMSTVKISDSGDGALLLTTPWGVWRYVEVQPLYFRQVDAPFGIVFREDDRGQITDMFTDLTPMFAFEKLKWYETLEFNMALILGCALIFLSMIVVAAIRFIRNRRPGGDRKPAIGGVGVAQGILLGICVLNLLFLVGTSQWGNPAPVFGVSMIYKIVLGLGVLAAVLTAAAVVYAVIAWMNRYWDFAIGMYYTLVTVAAIAFVWVLNNLNLLGWRF